MKILQLNKFLMITLSLMVLSSCDNYELVNLDEYQVVKKEETREYQKEIKWSGLNISSEVHIKYIDGRLHYRISLEDLDGVPIHETDYYINLRKNGYIILVFLDKDGFELHNKELEVIYFTNKVLDHIPFYISEQGSFEFEESKYLRINNVNVMTSGV